MADFTVSNDIDTFMQSADKAAMRTNLSLGTSAVKDVAATGDAAAGEVVLGNDTRLTDARTPTSHTHTASAITNFDTEVANNTTVAANTSKLAGIDMGGVKWTNGTMSGTVGHNIGLLDFTISGIVQFDTYTPSAVTPIFQSHNTGKNRIIIQIQTNGDWRLVFIDNSFIPINYNFTPSGLTSGQSYHFAVTADRNGNATLYINGVQNGTPLSIAASSTIDVGSGNPNTFLWSDVKSNAALFNRALTLSEVQEFHINGLSAINESDKWGSITPLYVQDTSATVDAFGQIQSTITANIDGIGGVDDTLRVYANGNTSLHGTNVTTNAYFSGLRYLIKFDVYIPSGNTNVTGIRLDYRGNSTLNQYDNLTTNQWHTIEVEVIPASDGAFNILMLSNGSNTFTGANSVTDDLMYIANTSLTRIGCFSAYPMDEGIGYQIHDISSNHYDGLLSTTGFTHLVPKTEGYIREFSVDAYNAGVIMQLIDSSRAILPDSVFITEASFVNQGTQTVTGNLYFYRILGVGTNQIGNFNLSLLGSDIYINNFNVESSSGVIQNMTYKNLGIRSIDVDATSIDVKIKYKTSS